MPGATAMRIIPTRTMRLGGARVEFGRPVDVPEADAALALRHGWATKAAEGKAARRKADADTPEATEPEAKE